MLYNNLVVLQMILITVHIMDIKFQGYDEDRYDFHHREKKEKRRKLFIKLLFWIISIPVTVTLAILFCSLLIAKTKVTNNSMEPTLSKDDHILINTLSYRIGDPKRFDVIVFEKGDVDHSMYDLKRIYGLPGETIQIKDGLIYINGKEIKDEAGDVETVLGGIAADPVKLGENEYFVLADNRSDSEDSRFAGFGTVKRKNIIGKAWIRTNKFGFVNSKKIKKTEEQTK